MLAWKVWILNGKSLIINSGTSGLPTKRAYYPLFLDISGKLCVVLGGGKIAERKVSTLIKFKAKVKVISPKITRNLSKRAESGKIEFVEREYREGDLKGAALVFAATDRKEVNLMIKREADAKALPINIVNDPTSCEFLVPSIVQKGPITIAISTSGSLPLLSKKLRQEIDDYLTEDYIKYADKIGKFRKTLKETVKDGKRRKEIMAEIEKTEFHEILRMDLSQIKNRFLSLLK
jgi:precorrin-2 dehydrogenase/sirohydrochlorin ferrochelatase